MVSGKSGREPELSQNEWNFLASRFEFLQKLEENQQQKLKGLIDGFLKKVQIIDHSDQSGREIKLLIAVQACLPIMNLGLDWYPNLKKVEVKRSPDKQGFDAGGAKITLNWLSEDEPNFIPDFVFCIDSLTGQADGVPPFHFSITTEQWNSVFNEARTDFAKRLKNGPENEILFKPQAASDAAHFFAYMSEAFFISPDTVRCAYPDVYSLLLRFYRINPAIMQKSGVLNPFSVLN